VKNLRVTEADDGIDGMRKLANAKYDLIISYWNAWGNAKLKDWPAATREA
jgi:hypothetical protein